MNLLNGLFRQKLFYQRISTNFSIFVNLSKIFHKEKIFNKEYKSLLILQLIKLKIGFMVLKVN